MVAAFTVIAILGMLVAALVVALVAWVRAVENRRDLAEAQRRIARIEQRLDDEAGGSGPRHAS